MNLSKRLEAVATLVDIGAKVIDVGCDHAYLDIYLTLNNDNKCIATDINENALSMAKTNIKKYKLSRKIKTILTDGLNDIDVEKSDNIVICGMGTNTILDILNTDKLSDVLIISTNNHVEILREEVIKKGYYIDTEIFLIDKNKPYIIIKFKKGIKEYKKEDYMFGPILKNNKQYRNHLINKYKEINKKISINKLSVKLKYLLIILKLEFLNIKSKIDYIK